MKYIFWNRNSWYFFIYEIYFREPDENRLYHRLSFGDQWTCIIRIDVADGSGCKLKGEFSVASRQVVSWVLHFHFQAVSSLLLSDSLTLWLSERLTLLLSDSLTLWLSEMLTLSLSGSLNTFTFRQSFHFHFHYWASKLVDVAIYGTWCGCNILFAHPPNSRSN